MKRYDAFISYSRKDKDFAKQLQYNLEKRFSRLPKGVKGGRKRLTIIRDETDFDTESDLKSHIQSILGEVESLIVICSPNAKSKPEWVNFEIDTFRHQSVGKVIPILYKAYDNDVMTAIPASLVSESMPLLIEFRKEVVNEDQDFDSYFINEGILRVYAPILGITYRELADRHSKYERARIKRNIFLSTSLALIFMLLSLFAWNQKSLADKRLLTSESSRLSLISQNLSDPVKRFRLAEKALELDKSANSRLAIFQAFDAGPFSNEVLAHSNSISDISVSPDSLHFVTVSHDGNGVIWRFPKEKVAELRGHTNSILSADYSPSGKYIITTSKDGTFKIWDSKGQESLSVYGHGPELLFSKSNFRFQVILDDKFPDRPDSIADLNMACFNNSESLIASASNDGLAKLWDLSGKQVAQFNCNSEVDFVDFVSNDQRILTYSKDNVLRFWNLNEELVRVIGSEESPVYYFDVNGNDEMAVLHNDSLKIIDTTKDTLINAFEISRRYSCVRFFPDGNKMLLVSDQDQAYIFDRHGRYYGEFPMECPDCSRKFLYKSLSISEEGDFLIGAYDINHASFFHAKDNFQSNLVKDSGPIEIVNISKDGKYIVAGSEDGTFRIWESKGVQRYAKLQKWNLFEEYISSIDVRDDLILIVMKPAKSDVQFRVQLWNLKTRQLIFERSGIEQLQTAFFLDANNVFCLNYDNSYTEFYDISSQSLIDAQDFETNDTLRIGDSIIHSISNRHTLTSIQLDSTAEVLNISRSSAYPFSFNFKSRSFSHIGDTSRYLVNLNVASHLNRTIAVTDKGEIQIDLHTNDKQLSIYPFPVDDFTSRIDLDNEVIVAFSEKQRELKLFDFDGNLLRVIRPMNGEFLDHVKSQGEFYFLTEIEGGELIIWDSNGTELIRHYIGDFITDAKFDTDGNYLIISKSNGFGYYNEIIRIPISDKEILRLLYEEQIYGEFWEIDDDFKRLYEINNY